MTIVIKENDNCLLFQVVVVKDYGRKMLIPEQQSPCKFLRREEITY